MSEQELVPIEQAALRLKVTRMTMWRRANEWGLAIYRNPMDKRQRLVDWAEVERAARPVREA